MNVELARTQLRGIYAIAAGFLLLLGVPLYQAIFLAPNGYIEATDPVVRRGDFGPLLLWTSQHAGTAIVFHLIEMFPFLLAIGLPGALRRVLWRHGGGRTMQVSGIAGFAGFALAIVLGIVGGTAAANSYASSLHGQNSIARGFAGLYSTTTLISHVAGGLLIALFAGLACLRIIRTHMLLTWIGYLGLLLAALLAITAIQFSTQLTQAETTLSPFSFATLALWLVCIGVQLAGLRRMPGTEPAAQPPSDASHSGGAAPSHQSAGR